MQELPLSALARVAPDRQDQVHVPVLGACGLEALRRAALASRAAAVLPPTDAGWRAFLGAAPRSGLSWTPLDTAGRAWWGRGIPRNLLSGAEDAGREAA